MSKTIPPKSFLDQSNKPNNRAIIDSSIPSTSRYNSVVFLSYWKTSSVPERYNRIIDMPDRLFPLYFKVGLKSSFIGYDGSKVRIINIQGPTTERKKDTGKLFDLLPPASRFVIVRMFISQSMVVPLVLYSCSFYRCLPSTWRPREAWNDSPNSGPVVFQFVSPTFRGAANKRAARRRFPLVKHPRRSNVVDRPRVSRVYPRFFAKFPGCSFYRRDERWTGAESIATPDFSRTNIASRPDKGRL